MVNFDNTFLAKLYNVKTNRFLTLEETAFQKAMRPISEILKTITGAFPLSWSDGVQRPLDKCKINPYLAQNGVTVGGVKYKVKDGVTIHETVKNGSSTMVNTGLNCSHDMEFYVRCKCRTANSFYILQRRSAAAQDINGITGSQTGSLIALGFGGDSVVSDIRRTVGHIYTIKGTVNNGNLTLYVKDETTGTEDTKTGTYTVATLPTDNVTMFGNNKGDSLEYGTEVYEAYIKKDGTTAWAIKGDYNLVGKSVITATRGTLTAGKTTKTVTVGDYTMEIPICSVEHSGDKTENLFDSADMTIGEVINADGSTAGSTVTNHSNYISVEPNTTYTVKDRSLFSIGANQITRYHTYGSDKSWLSQITSKTVNTTDEDFTVTFTTPSNCYFVRFTTRQPLNNAVIMLVKGSTAPTEYVPFGYKYKTIIGSQGYLEDMGALNWNPIGNGVFYAVVSDKANGRNIYCPKYPTDQASSASATSNMHIGGHDGNRIYFRNTNLENTLAAAQADLQGVPLFYQRTTDATYIAPQVIDTVTDLIQGSVDLVSGVETEEWGCVTLDENANWTDASSGTKHIYYAPISGRKTSGDFKYGFCPHFVFSDGSSSTAPDGSMFHYGSADTGFRMDSITSLADWQAFVAAIGGITVWCPKATPTAKQGTANVIQGYAGTMTVDCKASGQGEIRYYANGVSGGHATNLEVD